MKLSSAAQVRNGSSARPEVSNPMVDADEASRRTWGTRRMFVPPGYLGHKVRIRKELSMKLNSGTKCAAVLDRQLLRPWIDGLIFSLYPVYASWHRKHAIYFFVEVTSN